MHIEHFEKGIQYSEKDRLLMAKKLGKLATYCSRLKDESSIIRVEAEKRDTKKAQDEVKVMITVDLPQKQLRSESRKAAIIEAFDRAVEKLEPQLIRYKEMHGSRAKMHKANRERSVEG